MPFKSQLADVQPPEHFNDLVSEFFWAQLDKFASRTLLVDYETSRTWTGKQIKETSALIARNLINRCQMRPNDDTVFLFKNNDRIQLTSLAVLFAGGSVCAGMAEDPEVEHTYMIQSMEAKFVFATRTIFQQLLRIRKQTGLSFKIIIMDDDDDDDDDDEHSKQQDEMPKEVAQFTFKFSRDLMNKDTPAGAACKLPVQVHPDRPAFVLLTSGSTGRPKPVGRSYRNSLYVCFSLENAQHLWDLNENSVVAGHLQLDHGTGTFCLKMTLAKGLTLVVINGYEFHSMLDAIERHQITDLVLGSAYVHNFITSPRELLDKHNLSTLRNFLAVGSKLASHAAARDFERRHPNCSIRQAFGSTECGFMCIQERASAHLDTRSVGELLPNLTIKLVDRKLEPSSADDNQDDDGKQRQVLEITEFERQGELYAKGPTVSPGYVGGDEFRRQSSRSFLADGFYKTNDIVSLAANHRLIIHGRYSEVLCLHDGWKVLPFEIEQVLLRHPRVKEAAVVGVPHPNLPTCHAPRAYVVLKEAPDEPASSSSNGKPTGTGQQHKSSEKTTTTTTTTPRSFEQELFDFSAKLLSDPKHLIGGIKVLRQLPRISVGKVDKKLLKRQDGYV